MGATTRLTLELAQPLYSAAVSHSARTGEPLNDVIADALELHLDDLGPRFEPPADLTAVSPPAAPPARPRTSSPGAGGSDQSNRAAAGRAAVGTTEGLTPGAPAGDPPPLDLADDELPPFPRRRGGDVPP